jgi:hypothetical protein
MRLPFEFAEPVDPTRVRPRPHPVEVDPRRRDPLRSLRLGAPLDPCPPQCG